MQKQTSNRPKAKKAQYNITNWSEYNRSLINRGKLSLWIPYSVLENWYFKGETHQGSQYYYSDDSIEMCQTIKIVFKLAYRQTQGFLESVFEMCQIDLPVPSYSVMCKRLLKLKVKENPYEKKEGEIGLNISADSTGLKVSGEGEWKVRKHGWSKHRTWRKLHMAINPDDSIILANDLTENSIDDADVVDELLSQIKNEIDSFTGDGAYDKNKVYLTLKSHQINPIIPPRKNARIRKHGNAKGVSYCRDINIRSIRKFGRKKWKEKKKYHRRSLSETEMFRYKIIIGDKLKSRILIKQKNESKVACKALNKMTMCGMPKSIKIKVA